MGTLDFYGRKVNLNSSQKLRYIRHLYQLAEEQHALEVKTIRSGTIDDLPHIPDPTLILSDSFCYLSLDTQDEQYTLCIPNKIVISNVFRIFFDDVWNKTTETPQEDRSFTHLLEHILHTIELLSDEEA